MDLATGAKRVVVAMQHSAKGKAKVVKQCTLPLTSMRPIDLLVTELAVIAQSDGRLKLIETCTRCHRGAGAGGDRSASRRSRLGSNDGSITVIEHDASRPSKRLCHVTAETRWLAAIRSSSDLTFDLFKIAQVLRANLPRFEVPGRRSWLISQFVNRVLDHRKTRCSAPN